MIDFSSSGIYQSGLGKGLSAALISLNLLLQVFRKRMMIIGLALFRYYLFYYKMMSQYVYAMEIGPSQDKNARVVMNKTLFHPAMSKVPFSL